MEQRFDHILNECLERLARGESLQDCLDTYPEQAQELVPLLRVAQTTQELASSLSPRPEFRAQALYRLTRSMSDKRRRRKGLRWVPVMAKPAVLAVAAVLLLIGAAGATTAVANNSVPGQPLYFVKTMKERVLLIIPRSDIARARFQADLAHARDMEMVALARSGNTEELQKAAERLNMHLEKAASTAVNRPVSGRGRDTMLLRDRIKENWRQHRMLFRNVLEDAPPKAKPLIRLAMEESAQRFEATIAALGEANGVITGIDAASRSIIVKPRFGELVRVRLTGSTRIMLGGQELSSAPLLQLQDKGVWVDYNPHTQEVREIHITR